MNVLGLLHVSFGHVLEPVPIYKLRPGAVFWANNGMGKKMFYRKMSSTEISPVNTGERFPLTEQMLKHVVFLKEFREKDEKYE